jgi:hypothetical protein
MAIKSDDELAGLPSMASLLELERLNVEVAVLRDCAASLARERDRYCYREQATHWEWRCRSRLRTVSA